MVLSHRKQHRTVTPAKELGWEILCGWADWSYHVLTAPCLRLHQVTPMGFWKRKPTLLLSVLGTVTRPRFWKVCIIFPPSSAGPSVCSEWTVFNQCAPKAFCVSLFPSPLPCIHLYVGYSRKALFGGTSGTKSPNSFSWIPPWTVQSTESMIFAMIVKSRQAGLVPASFSHDLYLSFFFPKSNCLAVSCSPDWPEIHYVAKASFELLTFLSLPPKCSDCRHVPPVPL